MSTTPDVFDALRAATDPIAPPVAFAARLREQLITHSEDTMTPAPTPAPVHGHVGASSLTPYLVVDGAAAAIDFYVAAFGAVEHHRLVGDDGRIGHAELFFGSTPVSLADEYPEYGVFGPITRGGTSTSFNLAVDDADAVFAHALALGATEVRPVADQFHGHRRGVLRDPWGHEWGVSAAIAGFDEAQYIANSSAAGFEWQPGERERRAGTAGDAHQLKHYGHGDLYYFTLPTADLAKAQAFYGAVLGWRFDDPDNGHVGNISAPPGSAYGNTTTTELYFVVDDIHAAVAAVRAHGGTALDPVHYDSGWAAECTDDQGTRFHLSVPADKYRL